MVQAAEAVAIHASGPAPAPASAPVPASAPARDRMELEELAAEVEADEAAEVAAGRQDTVVVAAVGRPSSLEAAAKAPAGSPLVRSHVHCRRRHHDHRCWRDCREVVQEVAVAAA